MRTKERFHHDWLPHNEEANIQGYWVPRPEEIEREKAKIRKARSQREDDFQPNLDAFAPPLRSQPI